MEFSIEHRLEVMTKLIEKPSNVNIFKALDDEEKMAFVTKLLGGRQYDPYSF